MNTAIIVTLALLGAISVFLLRIDITLTEIRDELRKLNSK